MAKRSKRQVKTYIQDLLQQVGWATYPQLLRYLSHKSVDVVGDFNLEITDRNVLLWGKLSKVVVDAITDLMKEEELLLIPALPQTYELDGFKTNQNIITVIPQEKLETPSIYLTVLQNNKPVKSQDEEA